MRRASQPDRWLDPSRGPNPTHDVAEPSPAPIENPDDRNVTFHAGRFFRNESSIHVPVDRVTAGERAAMHAQGVAEREARQAGKDANLARAVELGAALKVLAGEDG